MRKITMDAACAFRDGKDFRRSNTEVKWGNSFYLHGHAIAYRMNRGHYGRGKVLFSMRGWGTPTTRERLNGLFRVLGISACIYQSKHEQYVETPNGRGVNISPTDEFFFTTEGKLEVL